MLQDLPLMAPLVQTFPDQGLPSVAEAVERALEGAGLEDLLRPGDRVAITAGSRGIRNIELILQTVIRRVSDCGCRPCIISAMGSHGGGSVPGQLGVLAGLGITPENMGVPVLASDRSTALPPENGGIFYVNSLALEFDRIIVVNRIKPHTSFHGPVESGLQKMLAIGLGGPEGAARIHSLGVEALPGVIPRAAAAVLKNLPVALGLALLEDSREQTMAVEALLPASITARETELLEEARRSMPRLPFDRLDVLVVDHIGKMYSGTGIDTNVVGRLKIYGLPEPASPQIKRIVVLGLGPGSGGNAYGIGLADFTTRRLVDGIDHRAMYLNALTSTFIMRAMIPMTCPDDRSAIDAAVKSLGLTDPRGIRMVRIKNTLQLDSMLASQPLLEEAAGSGLIQIAGRPGQMAFDRDNNLLPF